MFEDDQGLLRLIGFNYPWGMHRGVHGSCLGETYPLYNPFISLEGSLKLFPTNPKPYSRDNYTLNQIPPQTLNPNPLTDADDSMQGGTL